jgi:hypothetical protein
LPGATQPDFTGLKLDFEFWGRKKSSCVGADDGSVTLYFGPKAPEGLENNWIPTAGKLPVPFVRFYGPTDAFFDKTFKMPDVELVK